RRTQYSNGWGINHWVRRCKSGFACNCCLSLESPPFNGGEYVNYCIWLRCDRLPIFSKSFSRLNELQHLANKYLYNF
ncbi:hypothetical protein, partial [aff. Roholtiella sp. LEGE 12411]|uniref:hypothetical protein n=1 Tax=aff. Roholtiella sp. LEGE 12411 TaxID=1828822 RepID=UPI001ABBF1E9